MMQNDSAKTETMKTEERKQHFDDIYVQNDPVAFKEQIIDALDYISDDFNRQMFDRLILPSCREEQNSGKTIRYVDLCCCFGNTTLATLHGMSVEEIRSNWKTSESAATIANPRKPGFSTTGIDISKNALAYGKSTGIFDKTVQADLNHLSEGERQTVESTLKNADVLISTASLVYLDLSSIEDLAAAFANSSKPGFMMVNFLNPFSPEKGDATKQILLKHLDFVGSAATRHRLLSPFERESYPDEKWSLLEIWVLRRKI